MVQKYFGIFAQRNSHDAPKLSEGIPKENLICHECTTGVGQYYDTSAIIVLSRETKNRPLNVEGKETDCAHNMTKMCHNIGQAFSIDSTLSGRHFSHNFNTKEKDKITRCVIILADPCRGFFTQNFKKCPRLVQS